MNGVEQGPHAFIVPLRDKKRHLPFAGITIGDCGKKEGYEGTDNGFIIFDNIRIPKANFLNRLSDINSEGQFTSPFKSASARFALSLSGLSVGRLIIQMSMTQNLSTACKIAIRFAFLRKQFGGDPKTNVEQPLIDYEMHRYRLFPLVAQAFSIRNIGNYMRETWFSYSKKIFKPGNFKMAELHSLLTCQKAYSTWAAFNGIHECRLACGGLGYSWYS